MEFLSIKNAELIEESAQINETFHKQANQLLANQKEYCDKTRCDKCFYSGVNNVTDKEHCKIADRPVAARDFIRQYKELYFDKKTVGEFCKAYEREQLELQKESNTTRDNFVGTDKEKCFVQERTIVLLEKKVSDQNENIEDLQNEIAEYKKAGDTNNDPVVEKLNNLANHLAEETIKILEQKTLVQNEEIERLNIKCADLEKRLKNEKQSNCGRNSVLSKFSVDPIYLEKVYKQNEKLQDVQIEHLKSIIAEKEVIIKTQQDNIESKTDRINERNDRIKHLESRFAEQKKAFDVKQETLDNTRIAADNYFEAYEMKTKQCEKLEAEIFQLKTDIQLLKTINEGLKSSISDLDNQLNEVKNEYEMICSSVQCYLSDNGKLHERIKQLTDDYNEAIIKADLMKEMLADEMRKNIINETDN